MLRRHRRHQPICILQAIRLHDEGYATDMATLDRIPHYKTKVCDSTGPILLLSIRQRA
jgi:hypothetical protein